MKELQLAARTYVAAVIASGLALFVVFAPHATFRHPILFAVLLAGSSIASTLKVGLPLSNSASTLSVSYAIDVASLLLLGPHETMIVAGVSAWCQCAFRTPERIRPYRVMFSVACVIITVQLAGVVYHLCGGQPGAWTLAATAGPLVGVAATYFVLNTSMIATAIALSTNEPIVKIWRESFIWSAPSYFVGTLAAAMAAAAIEHSGHVLTAFTGVPMYLTYRTYRVYVRRIEDAQRHVREISDLHLATVEALARAIGAKDESAYSHVNRVQIYAVALARASGMTGFEDLQSIQTAALLHDIGKVAVPEHILTKPGPLTDDEFRQVRLHPQIGAEIVAAVPFPFPVAPLIRGHHERWDGRGYPDGLKGEKIPIGARVLAIADSFEALMADRPYHNAMSCDEAAAVLKEEAGKALDAALVDVFVGLLPQLVTDADELERRANHPANAATDSSFAAAGVPAPSPRKGVFYDIALAHREIYSLYEIAQAIGTTLAVSDTMTLIASKLTKLVPFSACALFLVDDEDDCLRCRFATGVGADQLWQVNGGSIRQMEDVPGLQSVLVSPLVANGRFIGNLCVFHVHPRFYRDDHRRLLERVCEQAAAVINNSLVFERTQEESLTDPLTGLSNTRFLYRHLATELARAERLGAGMAVMVMDLDRFKDINDHHGHHVGDRALCEVARALRSGIRPYDICARFAGDEFVIVLADCGADEARERCAALRRTIDHMIVEARPGKPLSLGISIGAAMFPADGTSCEALLAVADSRMYQDKTRRGGGRRRHEPARQDAWYAWPA
jgi:diguanylate cyclase (GGDEF)-like protein/putative nucleotidyltransferase with HDIG domain